jgi:hypothetical protein
VPSKWNFSALAFLALLIVRICCAITDSTWGGDRGRDEDIEALETGTGRSVVYVYPTRLFTPFFYISISIYMYLYNVEWHLDVDAVELVEAAPRPAPGEALEELGHGQIVQAIRAVEHHTLDRHRLASQ